MINLFKSLLVVILLVPVYVWAEGDAGAQQEEAISGQELLDGCAEGATPGNPNQYCMRYVFGLVQVVDSFQQSEPDKPKVFCINPNLVSLQEVTETITKWLQDRPKRLNEDAYKLVTEALHENYPCSSQRI